MDILQFVIYSLHITCVITKYRKRKYDTSSSDETIENLLYFKDCHQKPREQTTTSTTHAAIPLRMIVPSTSAPPQPGCQFPKMCCSLSCGNDCGIGGVSSFIGRQMQPIQGFPNQGVESLQPIIQPIQPVQPQIRKRKKLKLPAINVQPPINARRDFGFAKAKIKSLISQDDDIRKILRDLVRVTMQKVDLLEMMNGSRRTDAETIDVQELSTPSTFVVDDAYDEYDE